MTGKYGSPVGLPYFLLLYHGSGGIIYMYIYPLWLLHSHADIKNNSRLTGRSIIKGLIRQ